MDSLHENNTDADLFENKSEKNLTEGEHVMPKKEIISDFISDMALGTGEEVSLEDDAPSITSASRLDFKTPEEELPSPITKEGPAELSLSHEDGYSYNKPQYTKLTKESFDKIFQTNDEEEELAISISVSNPTKVGDGMNSYVTYKVTTRTNLSFFKKKLFSTSRRFSDFLGLYDKLVEKHVHLGRIVPPAPQKDAIGTTRVKMTKDESLNQVEFIEKRRAALERFLNRTALHPVLQLDPDFREFIELETDLPRATSTSLLSGAGFVKLFNRVGDTVSKMTYKMDETDPWFEDKQQQIENLDIQMKRLYASVETLISNRKDLTMCTESFAKSMAMLGNCEEHTGLSRALTHLAEVEEKIEQLHNQQSHNDFFLLGELLKDYISLIGSVKGVFHQRVKVYQTWQHAQQMLTKKREQKAKLELAAKQDKVPAAKEEVIEWEAKVERGQEEFESISKMIRKEVDRFEKERTHDFKTTIVKYMESLLETQQQLIKYWESFVPEAKAIV